MKKRKTKTHKGAPNTEMGGSIEALIKKWELFKPGSDHLQGENRP